MTIHPPHRYLLARWHATRAAARRAGTWVAATTAADPVAAHAARARQTPPPAWERHLRARGIDTY